MAARVLAPGRVSKVWQGTPRSPGTAGSQSEAGSLHAVNLWRRYENLIFSGAARDFVILWLPNGRPAFRRLDAF